MTSGVMVVAEALNESEAQQGKVLVGAGGFLLGRILARQGRDRLAFRYASVLYCYPGMAVRTKWGTYRDGIIPALTYCPYLDQEIDTFKPKFIVALGATAFERLTGERIPIEAARGYVFPERRGRGWVIPTFDPVMVTQGQHHLAMVIGWDVEKAVRLAAAGVFSYERPTCVMDPPVAVWEQTAAKHIAAVEAGAPLALDIETPYKRQQGEDATLEDDVSWNIDRVSFATDGEMGSSVAWRMPYLAGIEALVSAAAQRGKIVIWNRGYDRPRVAKALGVALPIERCRDTMDAWHVLYNAVPKKLGFGTSSLAVNDRVGAWKHLSSLEPEFYSAMDAVMLWRNDRAIQTLLKETGQDVCYQVMCETLDPVLEGMTRAGVLIDEPARVALEARLVTWMGKMVEGMQEVVPTKVKTLKVWKTEKAAVKGRKILGREDAFEGVPGKVCEKTCGRCQAHPVVKTHVTRKTVVSSVE